MGAGEVVLHIADFLLEFATLRHEEAADVPNFIHPMIPNEVRAHTMHHTCAMCQHARLIYSSQYNSAP